jgi:plasmid stability protein
MSQLTIDLPQDVFERLRAQAARSGKPIELVASELLSEQLPPAELSERARAREVLRAAGLLAEPTPEMLAIAAQSTATLAEVQAAFARVGGQPLSEIVIEQRGPKT